MHCVIRMNLQRYGSGTTGGSKRLRWARIPRISDYSHGGNCSRVFGCVARRRAFGPDDGFSPSPHTAAAFGALPFAPEIALPAIRHICQDDPRILRNASRIPNRHESNAAADDRAQLDTVTTSYLDQGLILLID